MIRVFVLGVLGLVALVLVARALPAYPVRAAVDVETAPFARWEGVWEGEFVARRPDGTIVETTNVRQEYTSLSPLEQNVVITDRHGSAPAEVSHGVNRSVSGRLECLVTDSRGVTKTLEGVRQGGAIFWHRREPAAGIQESFREEVLSLPEGDLYTIDGFGVYGADAADILLFEGRYRRVDSTRR